jgi:hypothetical protein
MNNIQTETAAPVAGMSPEQLAQIVLQVAKTVSAAPVADNSNLGQFTGNPSELTSDEELAKFNLAVDADFCEVGTDGKLVSGTYYRVTNIMPQWVGINSAEYRVRFYVEKWAGYLRRADGEVVEDRSLNKLIKSTEHYFCDAREFLARHRRIMVLPDGTTQLVGDGTL